MKKLAAIIVFGIAFGLLEAIVVFYLQTIVGHSLTQQDQYGHYSVLLNLKFIAFVTMSHPLLKSAYITSVEMMRESSTIVMLLSIAFISCETWKKRLSAFLIVFAFWDIFYYVFLHFLINWPTSLFNIDVYFLLPVPWVGPVITPVVASLLMIIFGVKLFLSKEKSV